MDEDMAVETKVELRNRLAFYVSGRVTNSISKAN